MKILFNTLTEEFQPYPRADDEDVVGLDDIYSVYTVIQDDIPSYDVTSERVVATESVDHELKTITKGWNIASNAVVPLSVSMLGMRLVLIDAGLYQPVVDTINGIPDVTEKLKAQVWWDTARTVEREHPIVLALSALIGQTTEQVNALFVSAKQKDLAL